MRPYVIQYSQGRGRHGRQYVYIRPAGKCSNKSRRTTPENIQKVIENHFSEVHYFQIEGFVIGAKNEEFALREYWRICEKSHIGRRLEVQKIEPPLARNK